LFDEIIIDIPRPQPVYELQTNLMECIPKSLLPKTGLARLQLHPLPQLNTAWMRNLIRWSGRDDKW
jgi:hypothetical protein